MIDVEKEVQVEEDGAPDEEKATEHDEVPDEEEEVVVTTTDTDKDDNLNKPTRTSGRKRKAPVK